MAIEDLAHYRKLALHERAAFHLATDPEAKETHRELAIRYNELADLLEADGKLGPPRYASTGP